MGEVTHDEGRLQSPDSVSIYWQRWLPADPRALLLFVHGLGEHSGRYTPRWTTSLLAASAATGSTTAPTVAAPGCGSMSIASRST